MADDKELLDWLSPRKQREIDNQAAFLRYLLEREDAAAAGGDKSRTHSGRCEDRSGSLSACWWSRRR